MTVPTTDRGGLMSIRFDAGQTMDVSDLTLLLSSVEAMYGVLLTYRLAHRFLTPAYEDPATIVGRSGFVESLGLLSMGWPTSQFVDRFLLSDPDLIAREFEGSYVMWPQTLTPLTSERHAFLSSLRGGLYRAFPGYVLRVRSISINSPGPISLQGLGEPIKELRELIKDLAFRNRQERQRGDLEIEEARFKLDKAKREAGLDVDGRTIDRAVLIIANGSKAIRLLATQGKIEGVSLETQDGQVEE
jgi:hypothetical protein